MVFMTHHLYHTTLCHGHPCKTASHCMCHAAQAGTTENRPAEAQRREALASKEVAELRRQLEQQAAEAQHCNAKAEVCCQSFCTRTAYDGARSRAELTPATLPLCI